MESRKILLVEDSRIIQLLIQTVLCDYGYELKFVSNGQEALAELNKQKPDLLILDIMMPVMDGFVLLDKLEKPFTFPILIVSARADYESIGKAMELGADDYLIKPFNSANLINKVEGLLNPQRV